MFKRNLLLALLAGAALPCVAYAEESTVVSGIVVVAPSAGQAGVDAAKLGVTVESLKAEDIAESSALSITEGLQRRMPGINVSDTQGNALTGDVNFRGFGASPLQGAPQGLAVYLNGLRLNEAFGDTVNWDLVPMAAIRQADVFTNNPTYGLNALGGAIALHAKDGFSSNGFRASAEAGSFGSREGSAEYGVSNDSLGAYFAIDGGRQDGWRPLADSRVTRGFGDLGWKHGKFELHLTGGAASSSLGVVGPTPVDLLEDDREAIYTNPQGTDNRTRYLALSGDYRLSDDVTLSAQVHTRSYEQKHLDGNDADLERCSGNIANPLYNTLCLEDDAFPSAIRPAKSAFQILLPDGSTVPCPAPSSTTCNTTPYGTLDRSRTSAVTRGASVQLASKAKLFGRDNSLIVGASFDDSDVHFGAATTLAIIDPDLYVHTDSTVPGVGQVIRAAGDVGYGPVDIAAQNRQTGLYLTDTLDLTDRLFLTFGGRWNRVEIDTQDLTGRNPDLTASHDFQRFNPAISLAFKASDALTLFGGYSESNRAPTPLELGCSDPLKPCLLENSLVADPPLEQVVAKSYEAGAKGRFDIGLGRLAWQASLFQTDNKNDIVALASALQGRGYYANVPGTRRRGAEASVELETMRWSAYASYSYIDAEYRFDGLIASPNNPEADADGDIAITRGDKLGGIPSQRFKAGAEIEATDALTLGADFVWVGEQYFVGDDGNDNDKLPAYGVANVRAEYRLGEHASLFARVDNLFDREYATFGTYFDPEGVARVTPNPLPADPDPRTLTPAAPRRYSIGVRLRF